MRVGNFVETKNTILHDGVEGAAPRRTSETPTSARGPTSAPASSPATTTASKKHRTTIGEGVFVGSDSQLVAPVTVGHGAYVGAGATITEDVPEGALALSRVPQTEHRGMGREAQGRRSATGHGDGKEHGSKQNGVIASEGNRAMCGIVGYVGPREAAPILLEGLKRLEYRGYDSAGIATLANGHVHRLAQPGQALESRREAQRLGEPSRGTTGIGHTRWATHGRPTEANAHPHRDCTGKIVVIHNGIIENFAERKAALARGRPHVLERDGHRGLRARGRGVLPRRPLRGGAAGRVASSRGAYAVVVSSSEEPGVLVDGALGAADRPRPRRGRELRRLRSRGARAAGRGT